MYNNSFRSRGYLPHLEIRGSTYFITLRLAGTLPKTALMKIREEIDALRKNRKLDAPQEQRLKYLETKRIQDYLDNGIGDCWLKKPEIAQLAKQAILYHDGNSYTSHVCCIMPIICTGLLPH